MAINRDSLIAEYLDWLNNYATVDTFAEHRGLTRDEGLALINLARRCFEDAHPDA